jgi:hypothetical protein
METTLHRQLKELYAGPGGLVEQRLAGFRIDAIRDGKLVEIQHGGLTAIRDKIAKLLKQHDVLLVKPLVAVKTLVRLSRKGGKEVSRRMSPKRRTLIHVFDELIYFTQVFPHRRLTIEVPLIEVEERRYPGHGRRRRWRQNDFVVEDQRLVALTGVERFQTAADLLSVLPEELAEPFHSGHVAEALGVQRFLAQRIVYCLRHMGAAETCGKAGNAWLYRRAA